MKPSNLIEQYEAAGAFFPVHQEKLVTETGRTVADKFANVRSDTNEVVGVVGKNYKLIPYREGVVVPAVEALERSGLDLTDANVSVKFGRSGGRMVSVITLPHHSLYVDTPNGRDESQLQVLLRSGHDATFFVDFRPGAVRVACLNGMYLVNSIGQLKMKHTSGFNAVEFGANAETMLAAFKVQAENFSKWSRIEVTDERAYRVFGTYAHAKKDELNRGLADFREATRKGKRHKLMDRYLEHEKREIGATAWGVYNTLTFDASHSKPKDGEEATSFELRHDNVRRTLGARIWDTVLAAAA